MSAEKTVGHLLDIIVKRSSMCPQSWVSRCMWDNCPVSMLITDKVDAFRLYSDVVEKACHCDRDGCNSKHRKCWDDFLASEPPNWWWGVVDWKPTLKEEPQETLF